MNKHLKKVMAALAVAMIVWATIRCWKKPTWSRCLGMGAAIGFGALSRAELLALSVLVIIPLFLMR